LCDVVNCYTLVHLIYVRICALFELARDLYLVSFVLIRFRIGVRTLVGHMLSNSHEYSS